MLKNHKHILNNMLIIKYLPKLYLSIEVLIRTYLSSNFWQQISYSETMGLILIQVVIVSVCIYF